MFFNFFRVSIRSFQNRKLYFWTNVIGLSLGFISFIAIQRYVSFEKSFDKYHEHGKQIFRIYRVDKTNSIGMANSKPDLAPLLQESLPGIQSSTRFFRRSNATLRYGEPAEHQEDLNMFYADENFFSVFTLEILDGPIQELLQKSNTAIISKSTAKKLFGTTSALNQIISIKDPNFLLTDYTITNVVDDVPTNTHFTFDILLSLNTPLRNGQTLADLGWTGFYTYAVCQNNITRKIFAESITDFSDRYFNDNPEMMLAVQPISEIHLRSALNFELGDNNNETMVNYLSLIAFFILAMAYINYINFSTAKSFDRAKEVGVRKILGAGNKNIQLQMFTETLILNTLCFTIALLVFMALVHYQAFDILKQGAFSTTHFRQEDFFVLVAFMIIGSFLSSFYPARVLSSYNLVDVMKFKMGGTRWSFLSVRNVLTITQFTISISLIIITTVAVYQINFMLNQDKGINLNEILIIQPPAIPSTNYQQHAAAFKLKLSEQSYVGSVSTASTTPGHGYNYATQSRLLSQQEEENILVYVDGIDESFVDHYEIKLLSGRSFSIKFQTERNNVVINEQASKLFGFTEPIDAINQKILLERDTLNIVGVISNYNHKSLRNNFDPQVFQYYENYVPHFSVKLKVSANEQSTASIVSDLAKDYETIFGVKMTNYYFLDEAFNTQYDSEVAFKKISGIFSFISMVLATIGLVGLVSYLLIKRIKEISLRRVFGASKMNIMIQLFKNLMFLNIMSCLMATSLSLYFVERWLQSFAFKLQLSPMYFLIPIIIILLATIVIIVTFSIGAVSRNPIKWIRSE